MDPQRWFNLVAASTVVAVLAFGAFVFLAGPGASGPAPPPTAVSAPTTYRSLSIAYNPATGVFDYSARSLAVPLDVRVVITITNYDPSVAALPSAASASVMGTSGGGMTLHTGGPAGGWAQTAQLPVGGVSHTFSMSDGFYHLNVPIPPATAVSTPSQVTFSVVFTSAGTYAWGCVILCGAGPSGMPDAMFGSLTVG